MKNEWDFSKMRWRIDVVPEDKDVCTYIPELKKMFYDFIAPITEAGLDPNVIIKYIIYIYHEHSPFVSNIDDIITRKKMAMKKAGGDIRNKLIQMVMANEVDVVCYAAIRFAKFENNIRHMALMFHTEAYYYWNMEMIRGSNKVDVKKLKDLRQEIDMLTMQLFKGDDDIINFVGSAKVLEEKPIFPEDVVAFRKAKEKTDS